MNPFAPTRGRRFRSVPGLAASAVFTIAGAAPAGAATPTLGGLMNHINVGVAPNPQPGGEPFLLTVAFDDPQPQGLNMTPPGPDFQPPFDVLNGRSYNAQYGWLRSGRWGLTADETFYIERLDATAGLDTYEGGLAADTGGTGQVGAGHTLHPLFGTDESGPRWAWDLTMTHHWYATDTPGNHEATYRLYVENDATGQLSGTFAPTTVTLRWVNGTALPGDYNASGQVEQGDLDLVLQNWGTDTDATGLPAGWTADYAGLGRIEQTELDRVLQHWGASASPVFDGAPVPEPVGMTGLFAVAFGSSRRARRAIAR